MNGLDKARDWSVKAIRFMFLLGTLLLILVAAAVEFLDRMGGSPEDEFEWLSKSDLEPE